MRLRAKAVKCQEILGMLNKLLNNNEEKRLDIYRVEEPNVWYFQATENKVKILHGKKFNNENAGRK